MSLLVFASQIPKTTMGGKKQDAFPGDEDGWE